MFLSLPYCHVLMSITTQLTKQQQTIFNLDKCSRTDLKHDGHDVVADMSLPLQLLRVARRVRQQRRHVEHYLAVHKLLVHGFCACVTVHYI